MKKVFLLAIVCIIPGFAQIHLEDMMSDDEKIQTGVATLTANEKMALELWINKNFVPRGNAPAPAPKSEENLYLSENIEGGKKLRLSDGSTYEISPDDVQLTNFWITPFPIKILPSQDPNYPILIINTNTGTAVKAKLLPIGGVQSTPPPAQPTIKPQ